MNKTPIGWAKNPDGTQGYSWNPITGCLNGCEYCYARRLANTRLKERYLANRTYASYNGLPHGLGYTAPEIDPFYPRFWPEKLDIRRFYDYGDCRNHAKRRGIFACDMSDIFGIGVPPDWTFKVMQMIWACPQDRFYILTKQPQNLIKFSPFPDNAWVGVSVTDNGSFLKALPHLMGIEAKVKYLSVEPLLDEIYLTNISIEGLNWVIIGAQTKPTIMPKIEWVREIVEACDKAGIPVFLKNNLNSENLPGNAFDEVGLVRQEMPK